MSRPLACVAAEDFLYKAAARMRRLGVRHLGVVDEAGRIVGALSARDLLRSAGGSAIALGDEIDAAETISDLAAAWAGLPAVANALRADGVTGREVAAVISEELGRATMAAARIVGRRMQTGRGGPPCEYAVAVLGSAGRGESLLALDQDNALVFAHGAPGGREDAWFAELGAGIADILDEIGVPYCKGGVMARNAEWRGSLETWRQRIAGWIARTTPEDLLSVDIFYDLRAVYGHTHLGLGLRSEAYAAAAGNAGFAKLIAASVGALEPGLGLFHRIRTVNGRIDLKRAGLIAIVGAARAIAVRHGAEARSTPDRLRAAKARSPEGHTDLDALIEAHGVLMDLILDQQIADLGHGIPPSNSVSVKTLSRASQERLRQALRSVEHIDTLTRDLLFRG